MFDILSGPYKTGTSAVYACISGYTLTGTATILCDTNYQWSGTPPQCLGPNSVRLAASDTGLEKELTGSKYGCKLDFSIKQTNLVTSTKELN